MALCSSLKEKEESLWDGENLSMVFIFPIKLGDWEKENECKESGKDGRKG